MKCAIRDVAVFYPERVLDNETLSREYPAWTPEKIFEKTGINQRHIAGPDQCVSDLAVAAAQQLFSRGSCTPSSIDYLLLCTQSPDYYLPTTAALVQNRLGLSTTCGALDFNLGCSGFVYGLSLAKGLIETGQAATVLLITSETYSKHLHPRDRSVRTLFGDAAAATLVQGVESEEFCIGPFIFGTDGRGAENLIVPTGGLRNRFVENPELIQDESGNQRTINNLYMNGPEIFNFTLKAVPEAFHQLLNKSHKKADDIDVFVFHQANRFMLDHLRKKLNLPSEKFVISMSHCGNTVSSTIPIAIMDAVSRKIIRPGSLILIIGFGVGYSWAAGLIRWVGMGQHS